VVSATVLLAVLGAFYVGMALAHWGWQLKIEDKARTGHRLECRRKLYTVREAKPDPERNGREDSV